MFAATVKVGPNLQADEKSAVFYLKMAANSGDSRAQANLAARTASGEQGVEKNPYEAYALALKSATQKDPYGRIVLAGFYAGGVGVPADARKAFDLIKQGSLDKSEEDLQQAAQFAQAGMHETGEGTSRNLDESYKWYLIAAAGPKVEIAKPAKAAATALEAKLSAEAIHKAQDGAQQWLREHRGTAISADELFDEAKGALATGDDKFALVAARAMSAIGDARGETISGALKVEKAGEYLDDAAIKAKIKGDILSDPLLKVLEINVTTTNGIVTLSGVVDSKESIDRAVEIARRVKEVQSVENSLVVKGAG